MTFNSTGKDYDSLNSLAFASMLTEEEQNELRSSKEEKHFKKGDLIIKEGFTASDVIVIRQGMAKVMKDGDYIKDAIVRIAKDGDVLGWESLLNNHKYCTTAIAISDTDVCIFPKKVLLKIVNSNSKFCNFMTNELFSTLDNAYRKVGELVHKPIRSRLAEALIVLSFSEKEDIRGINILREDLANIVGATRETVTRILSDFRKEKLIEVKNKTITITNPEKIKSISQIT